MPDEVLDGLTLDGRERDWQGWLARGRSENTRSSPSATV